MERGMLCKKMGAGIARTFAALRELRLALALTVGLAGVGHAATVTNTLTWSVTNTPTNPADSYRVEEQQGPNWVALATVPAVTLTHQVSGLPLGLYSYRVVPVLNGIDGTPSNVTICGAVAPDTNISLSCTATVVP